MSSPSPEEEPLPRAWLDAYGDLRPDSREVERAYAKFVQLRRGGPRRATALQVTRWVLLGAVLGAGSAFAATGPLGLFDRTEPLSLPAATRSTPAQVTPSPRVASPLAAPVAAPSAVSSLPLATGAALSAKPAAVLDETWQRAARGLRERDFNTANAALAELARRGSSTERESAELVRAQLLLAQGREEQASELLRALSAAAKSLAVRQKATELLTRTPALQPARRSFEPLPASKEP